MPLIDSLQSGYPTVQPGQGTSLLDLLQGLLGPSGNAPTGTPSNYAMGTPDPMAQGPQFTNGTGAPMGFGAPSAIPAAQDPNQPPIVSSPTAAAPSSSGSPLFQPSAGDIKSAPVPAGTGTMPGAPGMGLTNGAPDASIPDTSQDPSQGGLLGAFSSSLSSAAQSPDAAKSLLSSFADTARSVSDKLTNLSPSASQALIASGLTILAGNDGTRNLAQLVGQGGIAGVNAYDTSKQNIIANNLAQQKLAQEAQQQLFENQNARAKTAIDAYNATNGPVVVPAGSSLFQKNGQPIAQGAPQVARTIDVQMPDGTTVTRQYGQNGQQIGPDIPKSNPYIGPLDAPAQATVNAAQTAAAQAVQTYQRTAYLANQLQNADFSGGVPAAIDDTLTKLTGNKDSGQQLRGQLAQFANNSILGELPPGSASDKDIELVRNGVPSDTASIGTWQAYLASVGRVQQAAAVLQSAKADYASANRGNLGPLMRPAVINGIQYPAGTSFTQVASGVQPQQQQPGQQPQQGAGAVPYSSLQAEARRRGLIK